MGLFSARRCRAGQTIEMFPEGFQIRVAARLGNRHRLAMGLKRFVLLSRVLQPVCQAVPYVHGLRVHLCVVPERREGRIELHHAEILVAEFIHHDLRREQSQAKTLAKFRVVSLHIAERPFQKIRPRIARENSIRRISSGARRSSS